MNDAPDKEKTGGYQQRQRPGEAQQSLVRDLAPMRERFGHGDRDRPLQRGIEVDPVGRRIDGDPIFVKGGNTESSARCECSSMSPRASRTA